MNILVSFENFLKFVNDNLTTILVCIGLIVTIYNRTKSYLKKTGEEKIEIAKLHIKETILKLISDAEFSYKEWEGAGSIKRSEVIEKIFQKYPILSKVSDQEALIKWIDDVIDNSLTTLREIIEKNENKNSDS